MDPNCLLFSQRESRRSPVVRGVVGGGGAMVNFQCRGVLLIWIIVEQGHTSLAEGAGGVFGHLKGPLN